MVNRMLPLFLVAAALALVVSARALADEKARFEAHEGKVVSATATKLIMADSDGKEHIHMLAPITKVMLDGKKAAADDLKPGMRIRVTTAKNDIKTAVRVEALDKDKQFPKLDLQNLDRNRK